MSNIDNKRIEQELLKMNFLYNRERKKLIDSPIEVYKNSILMRSFIDYKELDEEFKEYINQLQEVARILKQEEEIDNKNTKNNNEQGE